VGAKIILSTRYTEVREGMEVDKSAQDNQYRKQESE